MNARIAILCLGLSFVLTGCRSKAAESFVSATTPVRNTGKYAGDPGSAGGFGSANGGTRLGKDTGARNAGTIAPGYDDPNKGSGQMPGENPGKDPSNGPVMQSKVTNAISGRVKN